MLLKGVLGPLSIPTGNAGAGKRRCLQLQPTYAATAPRNAGAGKRRMLQILPVLLA
jgi:hypothetical protein